jgi:hypothetical protein
MQATGRRPHQLGEPGLHVHVDVLVLAAELEQPVLDLGENPV